MGLAARDRSRSKPMSIFGRTPGGAARGTLGAARGGARRVIPGEEEAEVEEEATAPVVAVVPVLENPETLGIMQDDTLSSAGSAGNTHSSGGNSGSGAGVMGTAVQALRVAGGAASTMSTPRVDAVRPTPRAALRVVSSTNDENARPSNDENAPPRGVPAAPRLVPSTPMASGSAAPVPHPATLYKSATPSVGLPHRPPSSAVRPVALEPRVAAGRENAQGGAGAMDPGAAAAFRTPAPAGVAQRAPLGAVAPASSRGALAPLQTPMATPGGQARVSLATLMEMAADPESAPQQEQLAFSDAEPYENESEVAVNGRVYHKLACVGKGGSCRVYKVIEPQSRKLYAVKRVQLSEDTDIQPFINEIQLLQKMRGRDIIIQMVDFELNPRHGLIYVVMELGEIDLHGMLQKRAGKPIDANFIRLYWQQMLEAVQLIHEERIVHSDLKPANFLFVEGTLKLIDFGIAKAIQHDNTTNIVRDTQVGTLNYMSPESIMCGQAMKGSDGSATVVKVGRQSDVWSLGCILYQMVHGKTPFAHLNFISKLHTITKDEIAINFPPVDNPALDDALRRCLVRNSRKRITIPELLDHDFLHPERAAAMQHSGFATPSGKSAAQDLGQILNLVPKVAAKCPGMNYNDISKEILGMVERGQPLDVDTIIHNLTSKRELQKTVQRRLQTPSS